jgi:hypothetical protein
MRHIKSIASKNVETIVEMDTDLTAAHSNSR